MLLKHIKSIFLTLFLLVVFKVFATLPFKFLYQATTSLAILLLTGFMFFYFLSKKTINTLDIIILITLGYTIITALQAYIVFGQPMLYGILTQRTTVLIISGMFILYALRRGIITLKNLETLLFRMAFFLLMIYLYFYIFADPNHYIEYSFVVETPLRGHVYKFSHSLIIFLFIYSFLHILNKNYHFSYVLATIFSFIYLFGYVQKRVIIASLVLTVLIYMLKNLSFSRFITKIFFLLLIISLVIIAIDIVNPSYTEKYYVLIDSAFEVLIGEKSEDASANIRTIEVLTAIPYILENPLIGNGILSNQLNSSSKDALGYFYTSDIGIIGNIFSYGLLGTFIIYLPLLYAYRLAKKTSNNYNNFIVSLQYSLLFYFIELFFRAENTLNPAFAYFFTYVLYFHFYNSRDNLKKKASDD